MYRIIIQKFEGNSRKHIKQFTCVRIDGLEKILSNFPGHLEFVERKNKELLLKQTERQIKDFIQSDLFDSHCVGNDISSEEFLENEMFFEQL